MLLRRPGAACRNYFSLTDASDKEVHAWLRLLHAGLCADDKLLRLLERLGSAAALLEAVDSGLVGPNHVPARALASLQRPDRAQLRSAMRWLEQERHHLITPNQARYPALLRQIPTPPVALFVRGEPQALNGLQVAIVGSRRPGIDGLKETRYFAATLADYGVIITSGMARGIDAEAHRSALSQAGSTVAVLGSGLRHIYPENHGQLAEEICERGALVSEFPLSCRPYPANFPRRNRIISGLSTVTLIVEAMPESGSLITARHALEQNREVFAVPGSIRNPRKAGCHRLLREGAGLAESAEDILAELGRLRAPVELQASGGPAQSKETIKLDEREKVLLDNIGYEPTSLDEIVAMPGCDMDGVMGRLLKLELGGLIMTVAPGLYIRGSRDA